ncbi:DNA polymerase III subunit delta [Candidatus Pelagibacter bacterium nBUS_27]|uniref:DNA polymerase III subunit delta n=1 Tax=Candidatus Pelagibacter bacterium nBUS_27 TaxID=3374188 RepID=UPI003EBA559F
MILKSFEINKINLDINRSILFYGKNEGLKNETLRILIKDKNKISNYEEKEILDNENDFIENILSKSLFEQEKFIVIKRASDKILKIIETLHLKNLDETIIILNSDNLEKKSKLRSLFEKDKKLVCIPFYPDNDQALSKLTYGFLRDRKISISPSNINLIVNRCNGDREILINELQKIEYFSKKGKKINDENLTKLINLSENHSVSELIDNCLAQNKKKIITILNENNYNNEDCIIIARSFLIKAKKLLNLSKTFETNKNIDLTISSAKPPIFWKEKEITKQQIQKRNPKNIKKLIFELSEIELQIKKNIHNSINLITDFILNQSSSKINS